MINPIIMMSIIFICQSEVKLEHVVLYVFIYFDSSMFSNHKVFVFGLFRELLSQQQHYDWGLRALKTVLRGCGNLLQAHKQTSGQGKCH